MPGPCSSTPTGLDLSAVPAETGRYIADRKLIRPTDRVLLMVSGGADSTAMLHILHRLSLGEVPGHAGGFSLGVCHVNYGIRSDASDADEDFVRELGDRLQVPVHAIRAPVEERSNFQAWARDFRYLAAQNLCSWQGYTKIAVAHNRDDRIETFLYRLVTYSGRRSLVVMPPRRGRVIRPLLFLDGAGIREYCRETGIAYREDESNLSIDYQRNRLRHLVMPALAEVRPDFRERIEETILMLEDEQAALDRVTDEAWEQVLAPPADEAETDSPPLSAASLALLDRAVARLVLRRWLTSSGAAERLTRRLLDAVVDLCGSSSGTRRLSLPGGMAVERRYDRLLLLAADDGGQAEPEPVELPVPGSADFGDYRIEAQRLPDGGRRDEGPASIVIDGERLTGPLMVRAWRDGDRFRPLGMDGSKSLQDLFTDEKVPEPQRRRVPIITCDDVIVWVCGYRMSEDFRLTPGSMQRIGLKVSRREIEDAV